MWSWDQSWGGCWWRRDNFRRQGHTGSWYTWCRHNVLKTNQADQMLDILNIDIIQVCERLSSSLSLAPNTSGRFPQCSQFHSHLCSPSQSVPPLSYPTSEYSLCGHAFISATRRRSTHLWWTTAWFKANEGSIHVKTLNLLVFGCTSLHWCFFRKLST